MAEEATAAEAAVEQVLTADEEIHWQDTTRNYSYLPHIVGGFAVLLGGMLTAPVLLFLGGLEGPGVLIGGGLLLWSPVGYLLYRRLSGPGGPHAYVATNRRILVVPESAPDQARSIPWDEVDSMVITTNEHGTSDGIAIETGEEERSPQVWGPPSSGVLINHPSGTVEDTVRQLHELRREYDSFDPESVDPTRVGWSVSPANVSEALEAELEPGETVRWYATGDKEGFHAIWKLAAVFVAVHVFAGCYWVATSVLSLPSTPAGIAALLPASGSVWALKAGVHRWQEPPEYVATDQRLLASGGRDGMETVRWEAVSEIKRSGNYITVSTPDEPEALRFGRIPDLGTACRYLEHLHHQRS